MEFAWAIPQAVFMLLLTWTKGLSRESLVPNLSPVPSINWEEIVSQYTFFGRLDIDLAVWNLPLELLRGFILGGMWHVFFSHRLESFHGSCSVLLPN